MNDLQTHVTDYLDYCQNQKRLDAKTLRAYRIDLSQFCSHIQTVDILEITPKLLEDFITGLHQKYKPRTVKRKIASLKALFHYFEYRDLIERNPFSKIQVKFREPVLLPKTIPLHTVETFLSTIYKQLSDAKTDYKKRNALRDAAVIELLFATGMRISELCSLNQESVNLYDRTILIYGKGSKERKVQIGNDDVVSILERYKADFLTEIQSCGHFFANQNGKELSDQAVRRMINRYTSLAAIDLHITPHMFRHTFATSLLEADVDIRYIQEILGHSSINITEIYTHVAMSKQRDILTTKHPKTDQEWEQVASLLPPEKTGKPGRPSKDNCIMLNGMVWIARSGAPWRDLPERYGPWNSVYNRFRKWIDDGILDNILRALSLEAELCELSLDATIVQAHQHSAGAKKGGLQTKLTTAGEVPVPKSMQP